MNKRDTDIESVLRSTFGVEEFRTSQKEIIYRALSGGHSLVLMPTGMGKSLCYQLPSQITRGLTLVISPLIALMKDQVDQLLGLGIDAAFINSSLSGREREQRYRALREGRYSILFVSPERFRKKEFTDAIAGREISLLALDEAHCVSQWGNDFRPDYSRIREFRQILGNPVTMALTATATKRVQDDIIAKTGIDPSDMAVFNEGVCRPNLSLEVHETIDEPEKFESILGLLRGAKGGVIVYFSLIKSLERFAAYLDMKDTRYRMYHGKLGAEQRRKVQQEFIRPGDSLMIATNAFGMGIDRPDIRMIIHAEVPDSVESYYQEIGRAGRDGKDSRCVLFYSQEDLAVQMSFLEWRNPDAGFIRNTHRLMEKMGESVNSYTYEELQEELVHKNRGDHRLQTVLNILDLNGVTTGSLESGTLRLVSELPDELVSEEIIRSKMDSDRQRLVDMVGYVREPVCRRNYIHDYFGMNPVDCGNCDLCDGE